jgi:hypothetical protein
MYNTCIGSCSVGKDHELRVVTLIVVVVVVLSAIPFGLATAAAVVRVFVVVLTARLGLGTRIGTRASALLVLIISLFKSDNDIKGIFIYDDMYN